MQYSDCIQGVKAGMYKVIVVDDEQLEREAVKHILKNSGLPVTIAGEAVDGLEAVELFYAADPDIVLIDIKMPCNDGLEVAHKMLESGTDPIIIFLTAYDEFEYAQKAIRLGAFDYVLKPVRPEEVIRTVHKAIREIERRKHVQSQRRGKKERPLPERCAQSPFDPAAIDFGLQGLKNLAGFLCPGNSAWIVLVVGAYRQKEEDQDNYIIRTSEAKQKVLHIINSNTHFFDTVLLSSTELDKIVVLICAKEGLSNDDIGKMAHGWAGTIRERIVQANLGPVMIGIGQPFTNLDEIYESYLHAREAFIDDPLPAGASRSLPDPGGGLNIFVSDSDEIKKILNDHIVNREWDGILKVYKEWYMEIVKSDAPLYVKKASVTDMVIGMSRTAIEEGVEKGKIIDLVADFQNQLNVSDCLMGLVDYLILIIGEIEDLIDDCQKTYSARIIAQATEYIKNHYRMNIRMEEVAKAVNLSTYYFSRLFKKETDTTFLDYLTNLRIKKAKQLLRDQSMTITEVAQAVGYLEACYFSRVFKKHEKLSPSEYRNRIKKSC
jgi:two-component system response regulator YesN